MKPLTVQQTDRETLEELGRASVQVVHDLKNQLNGLKLYATFLRKRLQRREAAADEIETVDKLMAGLERATADAQVLVHLGRPLELKRRPATSLRKLLRAIADEDELQVAADADDLAGEFDVARLTEALRFVTERARGGDAGARASLSLERADEANAALIVWRGVRFPSGDDDPFATFGGSSNLRLALARRVIEAHGGSIRREGDTVAARLPAN